jgi:SAM-dependent methyltransferase/uncharacterized membrane protein YphA (DoxX/SURF4 family)
MDLIAWCARLFLGALFLLGGIGKLARFTAWQQAVAHLRFSGKTANAFAILIPFLELTAAALLLASGTSRLGAGAALGLAVISTASVRRSAETLRRGTLVRNSLLAAAALLVLWRGGWTPQLGSMLTSAGFDPAAWTALLVGIVALTLGLVEFWMLLNLMRQQGRMLERLDQVQRALGFVPDAIFHPTKRGAVDAMLRLGDVTAADTVYDLGCGDGRIVIAAAERGAQAVGVEIDPERLYAARANAEAEREKVMDRARFMKQNLFEVDLTPATVVTLYLGNEVNEKLRPKLLRELRAGTRVLSHDFLMGDWEPDRKNEEDRVFLWVIPAHVSGTWSWELPDGHRVTAHLEQSYQKVSGVLTLGTDTVPIPLATLSGQEITLVLHIGEEELTYRGRVTGDSIGGLLQRADGTSAEWIARRTPAHAGAGARADPFSAAHTAPASDPARVGL